MENKKSVIQSWLAKESVKKPFIHEETKKNIPSLDAGGSPTPPTPINWKGLTSKLILGLSLIFFAGALRLSCEESPLNSLLIQETSPTYQELQGGALDALQAWERAAQYAVDKYFAQPVGSRGILCITLQNGQTSCEGLTPEVVQELH